MLDDITNIKASEVLNELKDYTEDLPHYSPDEVAEALEIAIKALEQRWIPVSKKLPDDNTVIFYTDNKGETGMICYWEDLPREFEDIIAWMPLPEPYLPDICVGKIAESEDTE